MHVGSAVAEWSKVLLWREINENQKIPGSPRQQKSMIKIKWTILEPSMSDWNFRTSDCTCSSKAVNAPFFRGRNKELLLGITPQIMNKIWLGLNINPLIHLAFFNWDTTTAKLGPPPTLKYQTKDKKKYKRHLLSATDLLKNPEVLFCSTCLPLAST